MNLFYTFTQNNSGGYFDFNEVDGITRFVIIEAQNSDNANSLATDKSIYFNGCNRDMDCACCGDRWSMAGESEGTNKPKVYGEDATKEMVGMTWMKKDHEVCVHYLSGKKEWF